MMSISNRGCAVADKKKTQAQSVEELKTAVENIDPEKAKAFTEALPKLDDDADVVATVTKKKGDQ